MNKSAQVMSKPLLKVEAVDLSISMAIRGWPARSACDAQGKAEFCLCAQPDPLRSANKKP